MSPRKLKPSTIIPPDLYVARDADRQLHRVLEDMGRPGYVLVARQMGKTNLLIHAKRALENENDIFVYLDLSGAYRSAQECFRAIIDTALETHYQAFSKVRESIIRERGRRDLPAHKEHEAELRTLLSAIRGKLVIILDEIDALTRCDYSDQIFSQIRSTYFSRVNFSEYGRLTYALSGVAEPTELIKNPNLSPFNIGEKIYLDDFTKDEFDTFIQKAALDLPGDIRSHIFDWTSGSPRITWDICSELENQLLEGNTITKHSVDAAINKLYLTAFDKPPIDHIRTLVKNDKTIRNAIVQLRFNKGDTLSDSVRSRLYLAGIVKSDIRNVQIKNRVIEASLSDQWLKDIDAHRAGSLSAALDLFNNASYAEAIPLLQDYLDNTPDNPQGRSTAYSFLGLALRRSGKYEEAIPNLEAALSMYDKAGYSALHNEHAYELGFCHARANNIDFAVKYLEQAASGDPNTHYYHAALVTLAAIYQKLDFENHKARILELNQRVIDETPALEDRLGQETMRTQRSVARFNLVQYYARLKDIKSAKRVLDEAIVDIPVELKPRMLLEQCRFRPTLEERAPLLRQIADTIVSSSLEVKPPHVDAPLAFDTNTFNSILLLSHKDAQQDIFQQLMEHAGTYSSNPDRKRAEQLYLLAVHATIQSDVDAGKEFAQQAFEMALHSEGLERASLVGILKLHAALSADTSAHAFDKFLEYIQEPDAPPTLDMLDVASFANGVRRLQREDSHRRAVEALNLALSRQLDSEPGFIILLESLAMRSHHALGNSEGERKSAATIKRHAPEIRFDGQKAYFFTQDSFSEIVASAEKALRSINRTELTGGRRIGRNDRVVVRYLDGTEMEEKFKKIEADLREGKCVLVNPTT